MGVEVMLLALQSRRRIDKLLNLGLRDQELLFKFVQKHISSFGGDPNRVTIGGRSAGAHSAVFERASG